MSLAWRLARSRYRALDGEGARRAGGRWNSKGVAVVYASSTLSLAALELLVHVDPASAPDDLVALGIEVPDDLLPATVAPADLPQAWRAIEPPATCRAVGDDFVERGETLVLSIPSVIIPQERNLLINPQHAGMSRLQVVHEAPFQFDPRLLLV